MNHTLIDFSLISFSPIENEALENLWKTLQPLEMTTKQLSKDSVTLTGEEVIHKLLFNNINSINTQMCKNYTIN